MCQQTAHRGIIFQIMPNCSSVKLYTHTNLNALLLGVFLLNTACFADDFPIVGDHQQTIPITHPDQNHPDEYKAITVLEYDVPDSVQRRMAQTIRRRLAQDKPTIHTDKTLPTNIQLGMANVPVFDQGLHGTCTVFANVAALDAILNKGHYVSQLCLLQLGGYLENQGKGSSGWTGSNSTALLKRIEQYGIVTVADQYHYGCGGYRVYPYFFTPSNGMTPEEYATHREFLFPKQASWQVLFASNASSAVIRRIKTALHRGSRVVVSTLLPRSDLGVLGATGRHHYANDTWVLTYEIEQAVEQAGKKPGHTMIITGYDDQAKARDHSGRIHQGLFTLRNSWGYLVGDWGDFYMSYDYFEALAHRGVQITAH